MKIKVIKLGTKCIDKATETEGVLTNWFFDIGKWLYYLFQPTGLDGEGQPHKKIIVYKERLPGIKQGDFEDVDVPFEILGTEVRDKISGFTGMATDFVRHMNGCFHIVIQPKGRQAANNKLFEVREFDLRCCEGKMIKPLSEAERAESTTKAPSPTGDTFRKTLPTQTEQTPRRTSLTQ